MKSILATLLVISFSFQSFSQELIGSKKDLDQIIENTKKFSKYIVNDNYKMIGESYTTDAKIFPNRTKIIEGTKAIVDYWRHSNEISIIRHKITQSEIKVIDSEAYDYGYYEGTTKKANGDTMDWKGKYVIIWRKEGENWKMYLDIWNGVQ